MKALASLFFLLISLIGISQNYSYRKKNTNQAGAMYFYWGYNRSIYTKSNIHFYGDDYDFTIYKAKAHDNPSNQFKTYVNPSTLSVPQFNIRVGWRYNSHWDLSLGYDHMKYVMTNGQEAEMSGYIDPAANDYINGILNHEYYKISEEFMHYENSNGLNYISVQLNYNEFLYRTRNRKFAINGRLGGGAGPVVTQTDFSFNNEWYHTRLRLTGFGISAHTGLRFEFINRFFFNLTGQQGTFDCLS